MARMQKLVGVLSAAAVLSSDAYAQVFTEWMATWRPPAPYLYRQWPPAVSAWSTAISLDATGDVYVVGGARIGGLGLNFAVVKYGPRGELLWSFIYEGGTWLADLASAVAADNRGNCYVVGMSNFHTAYGNFGSFLTLKCGPRGEIIWAREYDKRGTDRAFDVAVDEAGNAYVTGVVGERESMPTADMWTVKYAPDGRELWARRFDGGSGDVGYKVELDGRGNVYVAGASYPESALLKYDREGNLLWKRYSVNRLGGLAVDKVGNACLTGATYSWPHDIVTVKYDPAGNRLWEAVWTRTTGSYAQGYASAMVPDGGVYVSGVTYRDSDLRDRVMLKYDSAGRLVWERLYDGPSHLDDWPADMGLDAQENVYVTGVSQVAPNSRDWVTLAYNKNGAVLWEERHDGPGHGDDWAYALRVGSNGAVYVTGSEAVGDASRFLTIKYVWDGYSSR